MRNTVKVDQFFKPNSLSGLMDTFRAIIERIGTLAQAWQVTDPMSRYVEFVKVTTTQSGNVAGCNMETQVLTWDLNKDSTVTASSGPPKVYTYHLTYRVRLKTEMVGFQTEQLYPTNGITALKYIVTDVNHPVNEVKAEDLKTIDFRVPTVWGTVPQYPYRIEFYKQDATDTPGDEKNYTIVVKDTISIALADLHTAIPIPKGYTSKYASPYQYSTMTWGNTDQKVTAVEENNVLRIYYDLKTATVTETHYLSTITKTDENPTGAGTETGPEQVRQKTSTCFVGTEYEWFYQTARAELGAEWDNSTEDRTTANLRTSISELEDGTNALNFYYIKEINKITQERVTVIYNFTDYVNSYADGKYVEQVATPGHPYQIPGYTGTQDRNSSFTAEHYKDYATDDYKYLGTTGEMTVTVTEGGVTINLFYEKRPDVPAAGKLAINHHYSVITVVNPEGVSVGTYEQIVNAYVGDKYVIDGSYGIHNYTTAGGTSYTDFLFTAAQQANFANEAYTNITIDVSGNQIIDIYYIKDIRKPVDVFVTHIYKDFEWQLILDNESGESEWKLIDLGIVDTAGPTALDGIYYVGGSATAQYETKGGTYDSSDKRTLEPLAESGNHIVLNYTKITNSEPEEGSAQVVHIYQTNWQTLVDGIPGDKLEEDDRVTEGRVYGDIGASFTVTPVTTYKGKSDYELMPADQNLIVTYTASENGVTYIYYIRQDSDLKPTSISVKPIYLTLEQYIDDDGMEQVREIDADESNQPTTYDTGLYVGMTFTAPNEDFVIGDYAAYHTYTFNPTLTTIKGSVYMDVLLGEMNEIILLYYTKGLDSCGTLESVSVVHHYSEYKWDAAAGASETAATPVGETTLTNVISLYPGQSYTANKEFNYGGKPYGFVNGDPTIIVDQGTDNTIHLYYERAEESPARVNYVIKHHYTVIDWNGESVSTSNFLLNLTAIRGSGPLGKVIAPVALTINGEFKIVNRTFEGDDTSEPTMPLGNGSNEYIFYYEKRIDSRINTSILVIHNYYTEFVTDPLTVPVRYTLRDATPELPNEGGIWVANKYSTNLIPLGPDGKPYGFVDATAYVTQRAMEENWRPYALTENGDKTKVGEIYLAPGGFQVIVINYYRAADFVDYTVKHEYYTNGNLDASPAPITQSGQLSSFINLNEGGDVARILTNPNNRITYTFTSINPAGDVEGMILLEDGNLVITLRYDRTTGGDGDGGGGTNSVIPVIPVIPEEPEQSTTPTTPEVVELEDEDVARSDFGAPDVEELEDPEVPKGALLPKTGSALMTSFLLAGAALTGSGLFLGRKRKDEDEETDTE